MTQEEILKGEFNAQVHKENFTYYLEVVIRKDGTIEYAIPSHNKKMEMIVCEKYNLKFDTNCYNSKELEDMFEATGRPGADWFDWLLEESEVVLVWNKMYFGKVNDKQLEALKMLRREGLYLGTIGYEEEY